jgi:hypothetical protein
MSAMRNFSRFSLCCRCSRTECISRSLKYFPCRSRYRIFYLRNKWHLCNWGKQRPRIRIVIIDTVGSIWACCWEYRSTLFNVDSSGSGQSWIRLASSVIYLIRFSFRRIDLRTWRSFEWAGSSVGSAEAWMAGAGCWVRIRLAWGLRRLHPWTQTSRSACCLGMLICHLV